MRRLLLLAAIVATIGSFSSRTASAAFGYAIGDGGSSLVSFSTDSPGTVTRVGSFQSGLFLDAIDFRPATGELYGYSDLADSYYKVNITTGALTKVNVANVGATTNTFNLGMDFNPVIDRLRVVTDSTQNIVFNPNDGTAASFTSLFYANGDVNAGKVPLVIDNAYTNSFAGATTTQQFVLDYDQNSLATLANNAGTLSTVAKITVGGRELDFDELSGFDINFAQGVNTAYAVLRSNGVSGLYTINLATGAATSLGNLGSQFGSLYSLAITPSAVPEPASLAMLSLGLAGLGFVANRRRSTRQGS